MLRMTARNEEDAMDVKNRSVSDVCEKWLNKEVWIEGTDPLMTGGADVLYSPMVGVLREVLEDGFIISPVADDKHEIVVFRENLRSIALAKKENIKGAGRLIT